MKRLIGQLSVLCCAGPVQAEELSGLGGGQLMRTVLGLLLVLGLVFALAWAARRISGGRLVGGGQGGTIRVVAQQAVGVKERLLLVEVDGRRLLLGLAPGRISRLADLGAGGDFGEQLAAHARQQEDG